MKENRNIPRASPKYAIRYAKYIGTAGPNTIPTPWGTIVIPSTTSLVELKPDSTNAIRVAETTSHFEVRPRIPVNEALKPSTKKADKAGKTKMAEFNTRRTPELWVESLLK
ncbi:MAG TPA: hypothetical protein VGH44_01225 [Candidatus Saccharimonadia bacterium]